MKKQSLIIGRFQPLCKNHLLLFDEASRYGETLLIAVGRPNYECAKQILDPKQFLEYQIKNLFSFEKTKEYIDNALKDKEHYVIRVQDIFDSGNYANHVKKQFKENSVDISDCVLVGENKRTCDCFTEGDIDVLVAKEIAGFHATDIRREIADKGYSNRLACELKNGGVKRIKDSQFLLDNIDSEDIYKIMEVKNYEIIE